LETRTCIKERRSMRKFTEQAVSKRGVAPQRCPVYATIKVLTKFWMIIPFTLKHVLEPPFVPV
jgi:hypothetical protein